MITSIAAPNTCPCCGRAAATEPQLPKLPKRSHLATVSEYTPRRMPASEGSVIQRNGRWFTID